MRISTKKVALFLLRAAIMVAVLFYAWKHVQKDDELALLDTSDAPNDANGTQGDRQSFVDAAGQRIVLAPGTRLTIVERRGPGASPATYEVRAPDGAHLSILAEQVDGSSPRFQRLPGILSIASTIDLGWMALALVVFGASELLIAFRWQVLLRAADAGVPTWTIVRLHYVGLFFTTFMPGGSGGDVVKAVYLTRHAKRKTEAVTMIFLDRAIGMIGLLLMAGVVVVLRWEQMHGLGRQIGLLLGALALGAILYFSTWVRKVVRWDKVLARLPFSAILTRVDAAVFGLRANKSALLRALGVNAVLQIVGAVGIYFAGLAIGIRGASLMHYLVFVPISYLANALPISFGGIGLMEGAFMKLFSDAGVATASQGFMVGLLTRVMAVLWSLPGGIAATRMGPVKNTQTAPELGAAGQG